MNFTNILREHNLKATPQRLAIINTIDSYGHINIDTLYKEIKQEFDSISLATIYKNINMMIENLLLLEVKLPSNKSVYETIKEKHSHLLCNSCHSVTDVLIDTKTIVNNITNDYNFKVKQSDFVVSGICKDCI